MEAFLKYLALAINQPDMQLSPGQKLLDLPNWDSLAILTTLSMLDQEYGVLVSGPDIQSCETVEDLYKRATEGRSSEV